MDGTSRYRPYFFEGGGLLGANKKGWFSCLLTYAGAGKRRLTGSVILSVVSVTAGLLPYYCVSG